MRRIVFKLAIIFFLLSPLTAEIMKLSEIKPGMEGVGKSIFKGTEIETFNFKVLGFAENFVPDKNLIWVELLSPILAESGVIAGMSGSPLYIDGKLIGAVAYGFGFSKKPIAGVTPIEDIIKTSEYNRQSGTVDISNIQIKFDRESAREISEILQRELSQRLNFIPQKEIVPIQLIADHSGFNPRALSMMRPMFGSLNSLNLTGQIKENRVSPEIFKLSPADAVTIPLITGDFEYKVSGTVTHVAGNTVYLFGHPFFNLGRVDFPLHKGQVDTVMPSYNTSFRITSSRQLVGTVLQDRFSAVQGELGRTPYMIPLKVFLKNRNRKFEIQMVNHPLLTPALASISLSNVFLSEYQQYGFNSIKVSAKIFIENERNIVVEDIYSSMSSFQEFTDLILAVNFFLMNNPEKRIKIQKMDFEVTGSETIRRANIENVMLDKYVYSPGEVMTVNLLLSNERGTTISDTLQLKAPNLKPGSLFYLMVADRTELVKFESKNIKTSYFPIRLNFLIRAINNLRKNNRIYFKLMTPSQGLFIKGYEYSNLPLSLRNVFVYNSTSQGRSETRYSTIMEYQMEVPVVVKGMKLFKLRIKER